MIQTTFFRLLKTPIDAKGEALAAQIAALNAAGQAEETFTLDSADLSLIPGSPFAYWVSDSIRQLFTTLPSMQSGGRKACFGLSTKYDFRFVRSHWEARPSEIGRRWFPFAKGGVFSPYYDDIHLLVDWENDGERLKEFASRRTEQLFGTPSWSRWINSWEYYFRPGLTWPNATTLHMSTRSLSAGCIFSSMGPGVIVEGDDQAVLLALLCTMNSLCFQLLVSLQLGLATAGRKHYEVGLIQRTPIPVNLTDEQERLSDSAREAHDLKRDRDRTDETTHAFCLPALVSHRAPEDTESSLNLCALHASVADASANARLTAIQAEIDDLVFDLYGLGEADRALVRAEMGVSHGGTEDTEESLEHLGDLGASAAEEIDDEEGEKEAASPQDAVRRVQDLLMWCVGVAFGRWDVRMALDPSLLPALQGPFDPLPRCAPGALVGTDGLPPATAADIAPEAWLRARTNVLDLPLPIQNPKSQIQNPPVAWDGILVDDPTHPADIVGRVRGVLAQVWGERADAIEREACEILGVRSLCDYFRDPRGGFFHFHIKRYSKSRRKAPIYWLLQSEKRSYALWLYAHRLTPATLYAAGRDYADAKVALEQARLEELRQGAETLSGSARKRREGEIEQQRKLVAEVTDFRKRLDAVALLNLPPDLNDGVVISIAPLRELVPWKEAERVWRALLAGEYPWSTMAKQMRQKGLVKVRA